MLLIVVVHQENVAVIMFVVTLVLEVLVNNFSVDHQLEECLAIAGRQTEAGPDPWLPGVEIFLTAPVKHSAKCPAMLPPLSKPLLVAVGAASVEMVAGQRRDAVQPRELTVTEKVLRKGGQWRERREGGINHLVGGVEHVELVGQKAATDCKIIQGVQR